MYLHPLACRLMFRKSYKCRAPEVIFHINGDIQIIPILFLFRKSGA